MNNKTIAVINGPNLNLLGKRDPEIYGTVTLNTIESTIKTMLIPCNIDLFFKQSNHEGIIIDWIHEIFADNKFIALIINAAAYTHTSIAILDALSLLKIPIIEVHLSDIYNRENYRKFSYISSVATDIIAGYKEKSYFLAIEKIIATLK